MNLDFTEKELKMIEEIKELEKEREKIGKIIEEISFCFVHDLLKGDEKEEAKKDYDFLTFIHKNMKERINFQTKKLFKSQAERILKENLEDLLFNEGDN